MDNQAAAALLEQTRALDLVQGAFVGPWGYMEPVDRERISRLSLVEPMKQYLRTSRKTVDSLPDFLRSCPEGPQKVEIMDRAVGKGTALLELGHRLGIHREEIMAVGDSENDLDMICKAGLGVAMSNGEEIVRAHADVITVSNDEDGCAVAIEQYAL